MKANVWRLGRSRVVREVRLRVFLSLSSCAHRLFHLLPLIFPQSLFRDRCTRHRRRARSNATAFSHTAPHPLPNGPHAPAAVHPRVGVRYCDRGRYGFGREPGAAGVGGAEGWGWDCVGLKGWRGGVLDLENRVGRNRLGSCFMRICGGGIGIRNCRLVD